MKNIWKTISICLLVVLLATFGIMSHTESRLKGIIIEMQEQIPDTTYVEVHDTITFDSIQILWKTRHDTTEFVTTDTFYHNDTITIVQTEKCPLDTFSVCEEYKDSIIDASIKIEGRGVYEKTFLDSILLDYNVHTDALVPKKRCCWLKRVFCGCN